MAEQIKTRIIHKHDLEANWNKATGFIPKQGEIIIYDRDNNYSYERIKIGDGQSYVTSLPFIVKEVDSTITSDSTNAVQSGAIYTALSNKVDKQAGKSLSSNDFTDDYASKLDGISAGAEVNQNAFSKVTVGSTTITADSKADILTLVAGANITLTPDATNDKITIAATDTKLALDTNLNASGKAADSKTVGDRFTTVENNLTDLSNDVTKLKKVIDVTAEDPNNDTLDRISEIVTYTQNNKGLIDSITSSKQDKITGAASTVTSSNLTANRVLISNSNGKITASAVTSTELGYLDGVSSSVQQQLDDRLKISELNVGVTGEGNAVTAISYDSSTKTIT